MEKTIRLIPREVREADWPEARFLSDDEQARYEEAVKTFNSERARKTLTVSRNGSNLFKVILLNQMGILTLTLPELDNILEQDSGFLKGFYADGPEVILRSENDTYDPNDPLARCLSKAIKIRNKQFPYIIKGLKLVEDKEFSYGLGLYPADNFDILKAQDFVHSNNQRKFSRINPDYSIEFDDKGTRTLYTKQDGVSRLCLDRGSYLLSGCNYLAGSNSVGRVVVKSAEGASQKALEDKLRQLQIVRDKEIASLNTRYSQAEAVLRGK